jgi:hypothetical protein
VQQPCADHPSKQHRKRLHCSVYGPTENCEGQKMVWESAARSGSAFAPAFDRVVRCLVDRSDLGTGARRRAGGVGFAPRRLEISSGSFVEPASKAARGNGAGLNMCENEQKSDGSSADAPTFRLVNAGSVGLLSAPTIACEPRPDGVLPLGGCGCGNKIELPPLVSSGSPR